MNRAARAWYVVKEERVGGDVVHAIYITSLAGFAMGPGETYGWGM